MAERTYTIPLRREWIRAPKYRRGKRTIHAVQNFITQHMKATEVLIGPALNLEIWKHGIKNPPARVKVNASKDEKGTVRVELFGAAAFVEKKSAEEKKGVMAKIAEKVTTPAPKKLKTESAKPVEKAPAAAKPAEKQNTVNPVTKKTETKQTPPAVTKPAVQKA